MAKPQQCDLLVVGLGPVGAVLAALCATLGLHVRAVEKDTAIYKLPRAVAIDYEALRLLNFVGVAGAVLANSCPTEGYEFVNREGKVLMASYPPPGAAPTGYPWASMFHQPSLEAALRARLKQLPNVQVTLGAAVVHIEQDDDGVVAVLETERGTEHVYAAHAVGCDGARSFVRQALGIDMVDLGFDEPWVVVDVKLPPGMRRLSTVGTQICDPAQPTTSVPSSPGRHRWEFMLRPDEDHAEATATQTLKARLARWVDTDGIELERSAVYEFHGLLARQWRAGRIVLIGDAAHQMPPFMGQGLCSGVRDACNLAWKLAAVLRGEVTLPFLDTVQAERAPHVAAITRGAIALGKIVGVADEAKAAARDRRMLANRAAGRPAPFPSMPHIESGVLDGRSAGKPMPEPMVAGAGTLRVDDVTGFAPLLVLADGAAASADVQAFRARFPGISVASLDNARDDQIGLQDESGWLKRMLGDAPALLAKPDRVVFGTDRVQRLGEQWDAYLRGTLSHGSSMPNGTTAEPGTAPMSEP